MIKKEEKRTEKSKVIAKKLNKFLEEKKYKEKFNLSELVILEKKVGPVKSDIKIGLISDDNQKIIKNVELLTKKIESINGVVSTSNSLKFGIDEIKIKVNDYGQKLGLTESFIGSYLSNLYLEKKKSVSFDEKEMLDIKIRSINKDNYENFKNVEIPLPNGQFVRLYEIARFDIIRSFEQLVKDNTQKNFYVYANVNSDIVTASEVTNKIEDTLNKIEENGVRLIFKGEAEKRKDLKNDMLYATSLALLLIMLAMLYLFNSFRDTFILMSIIPFSILGVLIGHKLMGLNLSMPSIIGALGLAGVVINDGIIMMTYLKKAKNIEQIFYRASKDLDQLFLQQ
ncbi:efflux RND transporter permease subunit [Malaciobacter marinus]|uniref:efflux RND transporter permease subunit n=1 Tax=Malaciobacter marinus TaxID=505249 RepID=UPI003C2C58BF